MHFTWIIKMHLKFGIVLISGEELSNSDSVIVILSETFGYHEDEICCWKKLNCENCSWILKMCDLFVA